MDRTAIAMTETNRDMVNLNGTRLGERTTRIVLPVGEMGSFEFSFLVMFLPFAPWQVS
jgi:hypothetical protein